MVRFDIVPLPRFESGPTVSASCRIPFKQPSLFEFPVFQAGPRFCLGKDMAQFEAKLVAAKLLRRFSFELKDGEAEKITYSLNITMSLCNSPQKDSFNLWVRPIPRASTA